MTTCVNGTTDLRYGSAPTVSSTQPPVAQDGGCRGVSVGVSTAEDDGNYSAGDRDNRHEDDDDGSSDPAPQTAAGVLHPQPSRRGSTAITKPPHTSSFPLHTGGSTRDDEDGPAAEGQNAVIAGHGEVIMVDQIRASEFANDMRPALALALGGRLRPTTAAVWPWTRRPTRRELGPVLSQGSVH